MSQETDTTAGSASNKPAPGAYKMDPKDIPAELRQVLPENVKDMYPAKTGGSYRGPVLHADDKFIVQAVGNKRESAVVHRREDVAIQSASLQARDAQNGLKDRNIQVHYKSEPAKAYPWDAEKAKDAAEKRSDKPGAEKATPSKAPGYMHIDEVAKIAQEHAATIKNAKQRDAFLKHFDQLAQAVKGGEQREVAPAPAKQATKATPQKSAPDKQAQGPER